MFLEVTHEIIIHLKILLSKWVYFLDPGDGVIISDINMTCERSFLQKKFFIHLGKYMVGLHLILCYRDMDLL